MRFPLLKYSSLIIKCINYTQNDGIFKKSFNKRIKSAYTIINHKILTRTFVNVEFFTIYKHSSL
jgi:hypothetical protein